MEPSTSTCFNPKSMDIDKFLGMLRKWLGRELKEITTQEELDEAVEGLEEVLWEVVEGSTKKRKPCRHSKRWWSKELTALVKAVGRVQRRFQRYRVPSTKEAWTVACRAFNNAVEKAKGEDWMETVFPSLVDARSGEAVVDHAGRGRLLVEAWFGEAAEEMGSRLGGGKTNVGSVEGSTGEAGGGVEDGGERVEHEGI
ncbi:hypothetical protein B0H13DRAFT_1856212 [Mycena leptocephala]|nr:hypothetical protein B0H13DRAFT_1856212 [Mycena leptocephala]